MSDTEALDTSLLEVMISSKHGCVGIHDLSDLTLQHIFDDSGAVMCVALNRPNALNNSRHATLW